MFHLELVTSTMDEARRLSALHPAGVVMADEQSAGRGRLPGRSWDTSTGQALLATAWFPRSVLHAPASPVQHGRSSLELPVALAAGLAVARACLAWAESEASPFRHGIAIKWPNDVLCGSRKLAGILCEATETTIHAGLGVNCLQRSFTGVYRTTPTSILMETGQAPDRNSLLALILDELQRLISRQTDWRTELDLLLAWKGRTVDFRQGLGVEQAHRGTLLGLAEDGGLILQTAGSAEVFHSGELSLVIDEYS
jgi:BirA family biotin operon repressor/biotin-[acetyl-CoA-carboxylase] ligase